MCKLKKVIRLERRWNVLSTKVIRLARAVLTHSKLVFSLDRFSRTDHNSIFHLLRYRTMILQTLRAKRTQTLLPSWHRTVPHSQTFLPYCRGRLIYPGARLAPSDIGISSSNSFAPLICTHR